MNKCLLTLEKLLVFLSREPTLMTTKEELKVETARNIGKVNRSRLEKNQTSLGRILITNIVTRVSYVNYEI